MDAPIVTVTLNPSIDRSFAVDKVIPERKLEAEDEQRYPGGGGVNVARVVTRLGGDAIALWSRGGHTGKLLEDLIAREEIRQEPIPIEGMTRENVIVLERASGQQYRFGLSGPAFTAADLARHAERLAGLRAHYLVLSGSLPGGVAPDWFGDVIRGVAAGTRVVVDTKGKALERALEIGVFLIKPNIDELEAIMQRTLDLDERVEDAARCIVTRGGAQMVLVSLGRGGAVLVTREQAIHIPAPTVRIKSKVGAGDSMLGAVVFALCQGWSPEQAACLGVAAGSAAVMNEGTELARREDTERLYALMTAKK